MTNYLITLFHPNDYDPAVAEDAAMDRAIDELNDEMVAAGVRVFVGGLQPEKTSRWVHAQRDGQAVQGNGCYLKTREMIGGLWVLKAATPEEALEWGRKASIACRAPVEVRPFH